MRIRAVFFDMGGTIETFGYTHELRLQATAGVARLLETAGINLDLSAERLYALVSSGLERYKRWSVESMQELPPGQVWAEYILRDLSFDRARLDHIAEELAFYVETRFYHREMRPEIPAALAAIRAMGLKMGIVSNVNSRRQVPTNLMKYGIRNYFDPIVLSSEYGRRKPDPAIFHHAARLAHVPTSACAYVGDRVVRDIEGARRAGFAVAIQIRHDFHHGEDDSGAAPDAIIDSMTELLPLLEQEDARRASMARPSPITAILFDAGDVLYYRPQRGARFAAFLTEIGVDISGNHRAEKEALGEQAYRGKITQDQYRESLLQLYGIHRPRDIQRGKRILEEEDNNVEFFEGVRDTLLELKARRYLLGIVTDSINPVHAKLGWFERGGFGHVWDSIISSKDIGIRKPDPKIYWEALEQLGTGAEGAVFVGHDAAELAGARSVGLKTIAFHGEEGAEADFFIEKFSDLLKVPLFS
jgi:putative hydrolase of the HAD superfamily